MRDMQCVSSIAMAARCWWGPAMADGGKSVFPDLSLQRGISLSLSLYLKLNSLIYHSAVIWVLFLKLYLYLVLKSQLLMQIV